MGTLEEEIAYRSVSEESTERSSSSSMVAVKRVLLVGGDDDGVYRWYLVKVSSSESDSHCHLQGQGQGQDQGQGGAKKKKKGRPQPRMVKPFWRCFRGYLVSFARIGSTLYCVGGGPEDISESSDVYVADMDDKLQWRKISSMLTKRQCPDTVVVHDKLYVFGGFYIPEGTTPNESQPWGEVYHPEKHSWRPLRQPPSYFSCAVLMFAVHDDHDDDLKTKILLGSFDSPYLFAYDVVTDTWDTFADDFKCFSRATRPVLRHNKLYWISHGIAVYDLQLKRMFTGPIIGKFDSALLFTPFDVRYGPVVFHIDRDEFCCIWLEGIVEGPLSHLHRICCTTIRISEPMYKNGGKHSVKGHSLFTQLYLVDHGIYPLFGLVLDGTFSAIDSGEKKQEVVSTCGELEEVNHSLMNLAVAGGC